MQPVNGKRAEQALRDSEARAEALLATAVDALVVIDERGIVETLTPAAEWMFGYTRDEVIGQNVKLLMPDLYRLETATTETGAPADER